jgi:hypothetical protein
MKIVKALAITSLLATLSLTTFADETITMTDGSGGRQVSITTATNRISITPAARLVSVNNAGSAVIYAAPRVSATEYAAMITSTNATPIPPSTSFEFVGGNGMDSITISGASGTNLTTIGVQQ